MSRYYRCDQCDHTQVEPMAYRLSQLVELDDDEDEVDDYDVETYHFCSTPCLDLFVMAIPRETPEEAP